MKTMKGEAFVRRLKLMMDEQEDSKFAFFLGAGCSVSSGIPSANTLVKNHWLPKLKAIQTGQEQNIEEWLQGEFPGYTPEKAAKFYGQVMEALFLTPQERQREIERLTEKKDPGFGYAVLAQVMSHEAYARHSNVVLTTNFDDLVADALYLYTHTKPLTIIHESLAAYAKVSQSRPLIIKLHGDAKLAPKNTTLETKELDMEFKKVLKYLLSDRGLIFLGYGGNDQSIAKILGSLKDHDLPLGVYWVGREVPTGKMGAWLKKRKAFWVKHYDFEELMLLLMNEYDFDEPRGERFERLLNTWFETYQNLVVKIKAKPRTGTPRVLIQAIQKVEKRFKNWWAVELEARKYKETDQEKAREIYEKGLAHFSNSKQLLNNYAVFLWRSCKDYDGAEEHFKRALILDENNTYVLVSYASLLATVRGDLDGAEAFYLRALEIDPRNAHGLNGYAQFLEKARKNYDGAEEFYLKVLEIAPSDTYGLNSYGQFLEKARKNYDGAEDVYLKALEIAPNDRAILENYGNFLLQVRKKPKEGEKYLKKLAKINKKRQKK